MSIAIPIYVLQGLLQGQEASDDITRSECGEFRSNKLLNQFKNSPQRLIRVGVQDGNQNTCR